MLVALAVAAPVMSRPFSVSEVQILSPAAIMSGRDTTTKTFSVFGARMVAIWISNLGTAATHKDSISSILWLVSMDDSTYVSAGSGATETTDGRHQYSSHHADLSAASFRRSSAGIWVYLRPSDGNQGNDGIYRMVSRLMRLRITTAGRAQSAASGDSAIVPGLAARAFVYYD
jgi:hypothetical protein